MHTLLGAIFVKHQPLPVHISSFQAAKISWFVHLFLLKMMAPAALMQPERSVSHQVTHFQCKHGLRWHGSRAAFKTNRPGLSVGAWHARLSPPSIEGLIPPHRLIKGSIDRPSWARLKHKWPSLWKYVCHRLKQAAAHRSAL